MDIQNLEDAERSILLDFIDALRSKRRMQLRRLTMNLFTVRTLTGEKEEVEFFRFLQAFREVPEFKSVRFELEELHQYKRKDREQLLQRAYEMRNSLLLGRTGKFEQLREEH